MSKMFDGDLISRSELIGTESLLMTDIVESNPVAKFVLEQVLHDIKVAPGVEVEPVVHAHWVELPPDRRDFWVSHLTHFCSHCGTHGCKHYKRCQDCGAFMNEKVYEPTPIQKRSFTNRVRTRLKQAGIETMEQLEITDKRTLYGIPGLGKRSILEIEDELRIWNTEKEKNNELLER